MPYIYQADCYCDSCGEAIKQELLKTASEQQKEDWQDETSYDSDEFPKWRDKNEKSDSPQHCGSHEDCLECIVLEDGTKIGALLSTSLTSYGVEYVKEAVKNGGLVAEFWRDAFDWIDFPHDPTIQNSDMIPIPYSEVLKAIELTDSAPFTMVIRSRVEWRVIANCVNQGIDAHLEAITDSSFDESSGKCSVSPHDLCVLLRRLGDYDFTEEEDTDTDNDEWSEAMSLQSSILTVLGFNDYGKYVGREALGLD